VSNTDVVEGTRTFVASFDVLDIRRLPAPSEFPSALPTASYSAFAALRAEREHATSAASLLGLLEAAADELPAEREALPVRAEDSLAAHDAYFRLRRVGATNATDVYASCIVHANALFVREVLEGGSTLSHGQLSDVDRAFATMLETAYTFAPQVTAPVREWPVTGDSPVSMRRWVRGHQVFTVLTQGLVLAVDEVAAAFESASAAPQESSRLLNAVDRLVILMRGSAGALRLTGDFSPEEYETKIRPTMVPPHVPEGFSGLLSSDHRALISRLRRLRPLWDRLSLEAPAIHARITEVVAYVYEEHKGVCANFVGTDRPSLVSTVAVESKSAIEQLDSFKASRLRLVAGAR
jgi:hypothetical protein